MKRLAIIGSNDLAKLIAYHASNLNWLISGFYDNKKEVGSQIDTFGKVIGNLEMIESAYKKKEFDYLIVGVGYNQFPFRKSFFEQFKNKIPFANIIHPSACVDPSVILGEGIFILPGNVIDMESKIDDNVLLNTGCSIAHHTKICKHTFLGPGVCVAGNVEIQECCFLGVGSTVLDNVTVISHTLIGGGAVVVNNINERGTYIGIPAKRVKANIYF